MRQNPSSSKESEISTTNSERKNQKISKTKPVEPIQSEVDHDKIKSQLNPDKVIGVWKSGANSITIIYTKGNKHFFSESVRGKYDLSKGYELIINNQGGKTIYILKDFLYPTNLKEGVKIVNEYTDYYYVENNGTLVLADQQGILEELRPIK